MERAVAAPPERVFDFLADLRNHWRLERRFLELEAERPVHVAGRADLRGGTVGLVAWDIRPSGTGSIVRLSADVPEASPFDRLFLALGGRDWFEGLFRRALENLDTVV